jgi:hypothetical protein
MINYDKWKLLNENFMSSQPLGIKKNNGFLAYNKLHEDEEIEDDDVEDMDDEDRENMDGEDMEDDDMEDMDDEDMEDDDMEDMDGEEYEDEDMEDEEYEDEDHEEMEDEEYEDMEQEEDEDDEYEIEHEEDEDDEDEGPMMGRVRSHHHSHDKHLSRPHHEMDTDEIDFAAKASDKMSRMYASCESMEYKMPSMNEWLSSVNGMMFPEELNDYIGKKGNVISEAKEEDEDEEEEGVTLSSRFNQLEAKIKQIGDQSGAIQGKQFVQLTADLVKALKPHVTGKLGGGLEPKLQKLMDAIATFIGTGKSKPEEKSILDRTKPSMNSPKYMKKGCGKSMKMMPKKMKMMPKMSAKKSSKNCGYSSKNMKKSTKR